MAKQETCAERLPAHLASRLDDLRAMVARTDEDEIENGTDELGPIEEYALGVSVSYAVRVDLSTGGPADYLTATVEDGEVTRAQYHFADWFDHAEQPLTGNDLETVEAYLESVADLSSLSEYVR